MSRRLTPKRARLIALGTIFVSITAVMAVNLQRRSASGQSDIIVETWYNIGGAPWLKPNLTEARVVLPDRPHSRAEIEAQQRGEPTTIHRVREYSLTTGSMRLRGGDPAPPQNGVIRIIALGDSVTHGWGVSNEESWPKQMELTLAALGVNATVINAGVPANSIQTMATWCQRIAPELEPDWILWTRRPDGRSPNPTQSYVAAMRRCQQATNAAVMAVLPPISMFDTYGREMRHSEVRELQMALDGEVEVIELTDHFRQAQDGRGSGLVVEGDNLQVVDQSTGNVLLETPRVDVALPTEIYSLFERDPSGKEALFFDDGHPDAEGFRLFGRVVADELIRLLPEAPTAP